MSHSVWGNIEVKHARVSRFQSPLIYGMMLLMPFLVFYWFAPFFGKISIDKDYPIYSIQNQMELQYSLVHGSSPLYVPGFAMGRSAAALTLGQLYHPISHLSAAMPGYWSGYALEWNTFFRLLSLGVCQVVLFLFFRNLNVKLFPAIVVSFLAVYNLRMLDMFRYGASLESYTGLLLLCAALGCYYLRPMRIMGPLSIILSTYLMVCGGHPQMMYLGVLSALIWMLFVPHVVGVFVGNTVAVGNRPIAYYRRAVGCVIVGLLLSSAYLLPLYFEFAADNATRGSAGYEWSLRYSDTLFGALRSLVDPTKGDVHGAFISSSLIIMALLVPLAFLRRRRLPIPIIALWVVCICEFLISVGDATPFYYIFWKAMPFASYFRTPGRIAIALPFFLTVLLAWLFRQKENHDGASGDRSWRRDPLVILAMVSLSLIAIYYLSPLSSLPPDTEYVPERLNVIPSVVRSAITWSMVAALVIFAVTGRFGGRGGARRVDVFLYGLLGCVIFAQVILELRYGTWTTKKEPSIYLSAMNDQKKNYLRYYGSPGYTMESATVSEQINRSYLERSMAKYYRCWRIAASHDEAYELLAKRRYTDIAIIEGQDVSNEPARQPSSCASDDKYISEGEDAIKLVYSSFNRVQFRVKAGQAGYLTYGEPITSAWRASVDGVSSELFRANGYLPAVYVQEGDHLVEFRYDSLVSRLGMAISLSVLAMIIAFAVWSLSTTRAMRAGGVSISVLLSGLLYIAWSSSLYGGDNLGTKYIWSSKKFSPRDNIAYGKPTRMSAMYTPAAPYATYSGNGVDGSRGTAFVTNPKSALQWWEVDLGSEYSLDWLVIYRYLANIDINVRVLVSVDGQKYSRVTEFRNKAHMLLTRLPLGGATGRYIRLLSLDNSRPFAISEVMAFGTGQEERQN